MTSSLPHPTYYCLENKFEFKIACLSRLLSNIFFKKDFILFLDRGEEREKERERNINVWLPLMHHTGDLACNPGTCPDWESNQRLFGSQARAQSTEPHKPGYFSFSTF